jgi:peptidoglycan/LPS O-acetylase OafA/YrhL
MRAAAVILRLLRRRGPDKASAPLDLNRHCVPLDGVRGLAVLMVLAYDGLKLEGGGGPWTLPARKFAAAGWTGVDLFFVLSGFLITGILLETRGRPGYWRSFLARRALRIFPLYYVTLLAVFVLIPGALWLWGEHGAVAEELRTVRQGQFWYWVYAQNWLFAWNQRWPEVPLLKHFWSLAVEEQFYLVWPLAVAALSRRQLGWLCAGLGVLAVSLRVCLLTHGAPPMVPHVLTVTRLDSLCIGGLLAIGLRTPAFAPRVVPWLQRLAWGVPVALLAIDGVWPILKSESFAAYSFGHTLTGVGYAILIGAVATVPERTLLARAFALPPLTLLGKYSYAIYVFHKFVYLGVSRLDWTGIPEPARGGLIFLATVGLSLLAAQTSWRLLEAPCLSLKRRFPRPDSPPARELDERQTLRSVNYEPATQAMA